MSNNNSADNQQPSNTPSTSTNLDDIFKSLAPKTKSALERIAKLPPAKQVSELETLITSRKNNLEILKEGRSLPGQTKSAEELLKTIKQQLTYLQSIYREAYIKLHNEATQNKGKRLSSKPLTSTPNKDQSEAGPSNQTVGGFTVTINTSNSTNLEKTNTINSSTDDEEPADPQNKSESLRLLRSDSLSSVGSNYDASTIPIATNNQNNTTPALQGSAILTTGTPPTHPQPLTPQPPAPQRVLRAQTPPPPQPQPIIHPVQAPQINPINQAIQNMALDAAITRLADAQIAANDSLVTGLSTWNAQVIKQTIPTFSGNLGDQSVEDWFETAEQIAQSAGWTNAQRLALFPQRFQKPAIDHFASLRDNQKDTYENFKTHFSALFQDEASRQRLKTKLENLKQNENERVRDFSTRLDNAYRQAYGVATATSVDPNVVRLREETKKAVFLKGLRKEVYDMLWHRIAPNTDYAGHVTAATNIESITADKKRTEEALGLETTLTQIAKQTEKQAQEFEKLREQMEKLNINSPSKQEPASNLVAAFQTDQRGRSPRVHFSDDRRRYHSGDRFRDNSRSPSRFQSGQNSNSSFTPYHQGPPRFPSYRTTSPSRYFSPQNSGFRQQAQQFSGNQRPPQTCFYCKKTGHLIRECRKRIRNERFRTDQIRPPNRN